MAKFRISGVWKDNNVIVAYAMRTVNDNGTTRAEKKSKAQAVALLEIAGNTATTWIWNYKRAAWDIGENVEVVDGANGKFLRSDPDNKVTDNLAHLINYDWIRA